jgi:hypothetical protein
MSLAARLAVRAEILLCFAAPINAAGKFVVRGSVVLVVHLFGAEMAALDFEAGERNGGLGRRIGPLSLTFSPPMGEGIRVGGLGVVLHRFSPLGRP